MHGSVVLSLLILLLCSQSPKLFSSCRTEALYTLNNSLFLPGLRHSPFYLPRLGTGLLLNTLCKWNPTVFVLLWLSYFTLHNILKSSSMSYHVLEFSSFFRMNDIPLNVCATFYSSVLGHLGCFYILTLMNIAAVNMGVSLQGPVFSSFEYIPRNCTARSCGHSVLNVFRNHHTVVHRNVGILISCFT